MVSKEGKELFRHSMPDEEDKANVSVLEAKYPGTYTKLQAESAFTWIM